VALNTPSLVSNRIILLAVNDKTDRSIQLNQRAQQMMLLERSNEKDCSCIIFPSAKIRTLPSCTCY